MSKIIASRRVIRTCDGIFYKFAGNRKIYLFKFAGNRKNAILNLRGNKKKTYLCNIYSIYSHGKESL